MSYKLNPFTGNLDNVGGFSSSGFYLTDSNGLRFFVDIDPSSVPAGALRTTLVTTPTTGNPIGPPPFLWMTYA